jgi:hypothetical protein
MATKKQTEAARTKDTMANLPENARRQLYGLARERGIAARSRREKWQLIDAIRAR